MSAPQPVVLRTGNARDKRQRVPHGVVHRSGFGTRCLGLHVDAAAAAVVHAGRRTVGGVVRSRTDERVLAAPLIIKPVRGEDIFNRRIVVGQRSEVAVHHLQTVEIDRRCFGVVIHGPNVPAPHQRAAGAVGSDHGVALLDLFLIVAVGPHVERYHAVLPEFRVLNQPRLALPHDIHRRRKHRHKVAPEHGTDQIVGLGFADDVTVGRLAAQILGVDHPHEKRRRNRRTALGRTDQHQRTGLRLVVFERYGSRDRQGLCREVDRRLDPARRFVGHREILEVDSLEAHLYGLARRQEHRRRVERKSARLLVLAARSEKCDGRDGANQPCESFHIIHRYFISVSKSVTKVIKSQPGAKPNRGQFS